MDRTWFCAGVLSWTCVNKHTENRSVLGHFADNIPNQVFAPDILLYEARLALETPECNPNSSGAKISAEMTTHTEKHLTAKRTPGTNLHLVNFFTGYGCI